MCFFSSSSFFATPSPMYLRQRSGSAVCGYSALRQSLSARCVFTANCVLSAGATPSTCSTPPPTHARMATASSRNEPYFRPSYLNVSFLSLPYSPGRHADPCSSGMSTRPMSSLRATDDRAPSSTSPLSLCSSSSTIGDSPHTRLSCTSTPGRSTISPVRSQTICTLTSAPHRDLNTCLSAKLSSKSLAHTLQGLLRHSSHAGSVQPRNLHLCTNTRRQAWGPSPRSLPPPPLSGCRAAASVVARLNAASRAAGSATPNSWPR
mmetsp:Transcript_16102/g.47847  ORF Transcript_16102/g.47847 Transcript_16102/m.47847 type:complete len:263 (+) Transcript_16102:616-1404(+)